MPNCAPSVPSPITKLPKLLITELYLPPSDSTGVEICAGLNIIMWAKSQFTYVGSYANVVFYIRGLLLCRWHTVPTCSRIPSSKFENSNILDHAHSILNTYIVDSERAQRLIFLETVDN